MADPQPTDPLRCDRESCRRQAQRAAEVARFAPPQPVGGYRPQAEGDTSTEAPRFVPLQPSSVQGPARAVKVRSFLSSNTAGADGATLSVEITADRSLTQADLQKIGLVLMDAAGQGAVCD